MITIIRFSLIIYIFSVIVKINHNAYVIFFFIYLTKSV
jgi:hypothetical protein